MQRNSNASSSIDRNGCGADDECDDREQSGFGEHGEWEDWRIGIEEGEEKYSGINRQKGRLGIRGRVRRRAHFYSRLQAEESHRQSGSYREDPRLGRQWPMCLAKKMRRIIKAKQAEHCCRLIRPLPAVL